MARLPQPGGDAGSWGAILNAFLSVEHNNDGTLKTSGSLAVKEAAISAGAVGQYWRGDKTWQNLDTDTALSSNSDIKIASQKAVKTYVDAQVGASAVPDATASSKGKIQLAGDLAGSAASPAVKSRNLLTVGGASADYPVANYPTLSHAVNQALTDLTAANVHGQVYIQAGTWQVPATGSVTIVPVNNCVVRGAGMGKTIIQTARTDYVFKTTTGVNDFWISDLTIDCQNNTGVSAVELLASTRTGCRRVQFLNGAQWFAKLGAEPSGSTTNMCYDCEFDHCVFDTHSSIYEMLLIYNAKNTHITDCVFQNGAAGSPNLGLWQKTENTFIHRCTFKDLQKEAIYYGITCNNTYIENCLFDNCADGVLGGNVPDNGLFGTTYLFNVHVYRNHFKGGANSAASAAVQFGAVNGCYAEANVIEAYQRGFTFGYGNATGLVNAPYASINGLIRDNTFKNINPTGTNPTIETPVVLNQGAGNGLIFTHNRCIDDQTTHTILYAVSFNTVATSYTNVKFIDNDLSVDTGQSGSSVKVNDGATLDSSVEFINNINFTNPAGGVVAGAIKTLQGLYIRDGSLGIGTGGTLPASTLLQIGTSGATAWQHNNVRHTNSNDTLQHTWPNFTAKKEQWFKTNTSNKKMELDIDTGVVTANGFDANLGTDMTTGGVVMKRLTSAQRDALAAPQAGSLIWNSTTNELEQYNGTSWVAVALAGSDGIVRAVNSISSATTASAASSTDYIYFVSGGASLTLPTAVGNTNRYTVKNTGASLVTILATASQTIDGASSYPLPATNSPSIDLMSDGANWRII